MSSWYIHKVMCCDPHFFPWILVLVDCCCESRLPFCLNLCLRRHGWLREIHRSPCWDSFVQWSRFRKQVQSKKISPGALKKKCSTKTHLFVWPLCGRHHRHHQRLMGSRDLQICPCNQWTSAAVVTNDTNDMTLNSKTTSVKIRWKLRLFCHWAIGVRGNRKFPANLQEFHVRESRPCSLLSETWQKYEGPGCSPPTPPPQTATEKAPPKRICSCFQMATGTPGGNISRIRSTVN